jgi:hypothetical protein
LDGSWVGRFEKASNGCRYVMVRLPFFQDARSMMVRRSARCSPGGWFGKRVAAWWARSSWRMASPSWWRFWSWRASRRDIRATSPSNTVYVEIETGQSDIPANVRKCAGLVGSIVFFFTTGALSLECGEVLVGKGFMVLTLSDIGRLDSLNDGSEG